VIDLIYKKDLKKIAIIEKNKVKTYQDLKKDIKEIDHIFHSRQIVILLCNNTYECLLIYLACLKNGSIPLLLSENLCEAHIKEYIKKYLPKYVFSPKKININKTRNVSFMGNYLIYEHDNNNFVKNKFLALLLTTSGSTGNPKVVKVSKKNLLSNTLSICKYLNLTENERHMTILPMNYTYGLSCINTFLYSGGSIILNSDAITTKSFWMNIEKNKPTFFSGVPFTYEIISKYFLEKLKDSSIRVFTQAGGKLRNQFLEKFIKFSEENNKEFIVMYGQTEATARMSYLPFSKLKEKIGSIGIAIPGGKFKLRNTYVEHNKKNKIIGELVYVGENVTEGYAHSFEELNELEEKPNCLNTGDIAWIDKDNYVFLVGRINKFAKISGIRVSLIDIEDFLNNQGFNCAVCSDDIFLRIFIENEKENKIDTIKLKKEISKKMNISSNSLKIKGITKLPRLDSGKVNYQKLELEYVK
tara:strand:- start:12735 stop:14147 length:1413 start_codon:yes stop_codon:yes gene_type:complete